MAMPTRMLRVQDADYNLVHELLESYPEDYVFMGDVITDALQRLVADLRPEDEEDCLECDEDETF